MKTMSNATRTIERISMTLTDCLSVPKTMGMGPIMMAPPPLTLLPPLLPDRIAPITAMNMRAKPRRIKPKPMLDQDASAKDDSLLFN